MPHCGRIREREKTFGTRLTLAEKSINVALAMEETLRTNLITLATAYGDAVGLRPSGVAKRCGIDPSFFKRILEPGKSFTVRTHDEVMAWFSANWPETLAWPEGIERPRVERATEGAAA